MSLNERVVAWLTRGLKPAQEEVLLGQRSIFILPSRYGALFATVTLLMLLCAVNYGVSMGYLLAFCLVGIGTNALWRTHRNLHRLKVMRGRAQPTFAGGYAEFAIGFQNLTQTSRYALHLEHPTGRASPVSLAAHGLSETVLTVPAPRRGLLHPGRFVLYTRFPLGLFRAWTWIEFNMSVLVYPKPKPHGLEQNSFNAGADPRFSHPSKDGEEFSGLRGYQSGDSLKRVAWKAMARQEKMLTKQYGGEDLRDLWLDWESLPSFDVEERLSVLCYWVLEAEASTARYGLKIPGKTLPPSRGETHQRRCLEALALHGMRP